LFADVKIDLGKKEKVERRSTEETAWEETLCRLSLDPPWSDSWMRIVPRFRFPFFRRLNPLPPASASIPRLLRDRLLSFSHRHCLSYFK
jgi:hypothetical protein